MKFEDKRRWARANAEADEAEGGDDAASPGPAAPAADAAELDAMRTRAEAAERKLREIQETFLAAKRDLEATRERLERDLAKKVEIKFAGLVTDLLETADDLDRAIERGAAIESASPVVQGVALARSRFLAALAKAGVERIAPEEGAAYDPNTAEAVGVAPVEDPAAHDTVIQVERAGYALGGRIIRPARVLVGRLLS